jgi:hypothetical protein
VTSAPDARVAGRAVSVSDVSGLEGSALTAGSVVLVPEGQAGAVAAMAGADWAKPGGLRHAGFSLDDASLAELEGTATPLDGSGRFSVDVAAARYLVCLADVFPDPSPGRPTPWSAATTSTCPRRPGCWCPSGRGRRGRARVRAVGRTIRAMREELG